MRKVFVFVFLLFLLIVIALPFGLRFAAGQTLRSQLGSEASFSDVEFGLRSVRLKGVKAGPQQCDSIEISFRLRRILSTPRNISLIRVSGLSIQVADEGRGWFMPGIDFGQRSKGKGPGVTIAELQIFNASVHLLPLNLHGRINVAWTEKNADEYDVSLASSWQTRDYTFAAEGSFALGKDYQSVKADRFTLSDSLQEVILRSDLRGDTSDFVELDGHLDLSQIRKFTRKKPLAAAFGQARIRGRIQDPLKNRQGRFNVMADRIGVAGSWAAELKAGGTYQNGIIRLDSIALDQSRFRLRAKGDVDPRRKRTHVTGDFFAKDIAVARKQHLRLDAHLDYDGPLGGDLREAVARVKLTLRHEPDSGRQIVALDIQSTRGEISIVSNSAAGTGAGGGQYGDKLSLSGHLPFEDIGPFLQIAGLEGRGRGGLRWRITGQPQNPLVEVDARLARTNVENLRLDSAGASLTYNTKTVKVKSLYAVRGDFALSGRGEWKKGAGRLTVAVRANGDSAGFLSIETGRTTSAAAGLTGLPLQSLGLLFGDSVQISGQLNAQGQYGEQNGESNWSGWIDWNHAQYKSVLFDRLSANFSGTGNMVNLDSLRIQYDGRSSSIRGKAGLPFTVKSPCSLTVALDRLPLEILPLFLRGTDSFQGRCTGIFTLGGKVRDPEFNGFLRFDSLYARPWAKAPEFAFSNAIISADQRHWSISTRGRIDRLPVALRAEGTYWGTDSLLGHAKISVENRHGTADLKRVPGQGLVINGKIRQVPVSLLHDILGFLKPVNGLADLEMKWHDGQLAGRLNATKPQLFMIGADSCRAAFTYQDRNLRFDSIQAYAQTGIIEGAANIIVHPSMHFDLKATAQGFPIEISLGRSLFWGDVHLFGTSDSLQAWCSPLRVRNLEYYIPQCDQVLRVAEGEARITGNRLSMRDLKGSVDDRPATVSGDIDFNLDRWNVHFWGEGDSLRISRGLSYWALVEHGDFDVTVSPERSRIKLGLHLAGGEFTQTIPKVALLQPGRGLYDPRRFEESQHMSLQIHVTSPESLWINNNLARARFGVDLTVGGNASLPIWQGRMEFYEGEIFYLAKDLKTPFTLTSGTVLFQNHQGGFNPQIDLEAYQVADVFWEPEQTDPDTATVFLRIHGPLKRITSVELDCPEMLSRWPDMARQSQVQREMTILSVLITGKPWEQLVQGNLGQVATNQAQSMFQAYVQAAAQRRLAQLLHLDAIRFSGGDWTKVSEGKGPDLVITDQLNPKISVEWASRVGTDILQSQQVKLQYKLRESLVVESAADQKTNYGMDLKYLIRF